MDLGASFYYGETPDSAELNNKIPNKFLGERQRTGFELNYTYRFLNLKSEYIFGKDGTVNRSGYYAQLAAFLLAEKLQIVGRYDTYDSDTDKADNIKTNYTIGANYFINPNILLQFAYNFREEEGTSIDNNIGSIQLQINF
jgi:hypothetical protein